VNKGIASGEFDEGEQMHFTDGCQFITLNNPDEIVLNNNDFGGGQVPNGWILLDNQSTVDVFRNASLLTNIRKSDQHMDIHCNAGVATTNMIGDLPGYGTVWYHPKGIANILSLSRMTSRGYRVVYDSADGAQFTVYMSDGTTRIFTQSEHGLFYMDMNNRDSEKGVTLVNTVAANKSKYTNRDYSRAVLARHLQKVIGRPSTRTFLKIIDSNLLPNCPVTRRDVIAAENIFGPDVGTLKGKTA
jgi:hypothetical protein